MLSAVTGYTLLIEEFNLSTIVTITSDETKTLSGLSDYRTNSISITEGVNFNNPISFAVTWGLIKTASPYFNSNISNFDFSINAAFTEFLFNTVGLNIAAESRVNKKTGLYLNTTFSSRILSLSYFRTFIKCYQ